MAYESGGAFKFLKPDLSTRVGAQSAMDSAKFCFLIVAGFRAIFYGFFAGAAGFSIGGIDAMGAAAAIVLIVAVEILPPLVAAWRLHLYKGAVAVPIATILYVLGILASLNIASLFVGFLFTAVFVGGIRGAWAMRRDTSFADDYGATFS